MSEILFERDERLSGDPLNAPFVEISMNKRQPWRERLFRANRAGFNEFYREFGRFECTALSLDFDDMTENKFHNHFDLELGRIAVERIESFALNGATTFPQSFDLQPFLKMGRLRELIVGATSFPLPLPHIFPHLEAILIFDWKRNSFKSIDKSWPELRYLHIQGFTGQLSLFSKRDLRGLILVSPNIGSIDDLLLFQNLDVVSIVGPRNGFDLTPVGSLPNLRCLSIEGRAKLTGWENFASESVEVLEMSWLPSSGILRNFPNLKFSNIWSGRSDEYQVGNWDELPDYPFSSVVPEL